MVVARRLLLRDLAEVAGSSKTQAPAWDTLLEERCELLAGLPPWRHHPSDGFHHCTSTLARYLGSLGRLYQRAFK
jgi:hypothetical protein